MVAVAANNRLAVVASYNGGGSGTFCAAHILDLAAAKAYHLDGTVYERINLSTSRNISLGGWDGTAKINGDRIEIITTRSRPTDDSGKERASSVRR